MADIPTLTLDEQHGQVLAGLLGLMDQLQKQGYDVDRIASAAVAAGAYYSVYNLQVQGLPTGRPQLDQISGQFRRRMLDYERESRNYQTTPMRRPK